MPSCCVSSCINRTEYGNRLFIIPIGERNKERRDKWIKNINRSDLPANAFVCENHFELDQFENNRADGKRPLKKSAVPTLFDFNVKSKNKSRARRSNSVEAGMKVEMSDTDMESNEEPRRSKRIRKPVKFEEFNSESEEECDSPEEYYDESTDEEDYVKTKEIFDKHVEASKKSAKTDEIKPQTKPTLLRCRTCLAVVPKDFSHILKKMMLGKTIKEIISNCVPQLSTALSDNEYICDKCYRFLVKLILFIDSCLETQEKLRLGSVTLEFESDQIEIDMGTATKIPKKRGRKRKQDLSTVPKAEENRNNIPEETSSVKLPDKIPKKRGRKRKIPIQDEAVKEETPYLIDNIEKPIVFRSYSKKIPTPANVEIITNHTEIPEILPHESSKMDTINENDNKSTPTNDNTLKTPTLGDDLKTEQPTDDAEHLSAANIVATDHNYAPESMAELLRCPCCVTDYRTLRGIKSHLTQVHNIQEEQQSQCSLCNMKFIRFKDMIKHRSSHGHACDMCDQIFSLSKELEDHLVTHSEQKSCLKCGAKFTDEITLNKHKSLHLMMSRIRVLLEDTSKSLWECPHCNLKCVYISALHQHIKAVHLKIKDFSCKECDKKFSSSNSLNVHMRVRHSKETPYVCRECGIGYKRLDYLDKHQKLHHISASPFQNPNRKTYSKSANAAEKEYHCVFCEIKTNSKQSLIEHLSIHADARKFECVYCGLKLSCQRTKYVHERTHEDPMFKHVCTTCWKRFATEESLNDHQKSHGLAIKKFCCCLCGHNFVRQIQLENHILDVHVQTLQTDVETVEESQTNLDLVELNKRKIAIDWSTDEENDAKENSEEIFVEDKQSENDEIDDAQTTNEVEIELYVTLNDLELKQIIRNTNYQNIEITSHEKTGSDKDEDKIEYIIEDINYQNKKQQQSEKEHVSPTDGIKMEHVTEDKNPQNEEQIQNENGQVSSTEKTNAD